MSYILLDDFNGSLNIVCNDDGSGEPLIFEALKEAEEALAENCQDGIIVPFEDTIILLRRINTLFNSGKFFIEEETIEDRLNFIQLKKDIIRIIQANLTAQVQPLSLLEPAPDNWDRSYSVDFFIKVNDKFVGIQIKPISSGQALNQYQWIEMHKVNHAKFEKEFGGKVFFVYSTKSSERKKAIYNTEVIEQIRNEIIRLKD